MRILYDGRIFQMQRAGGINRYFAEVISGLPLAAHPVLTGVDDFGSNAPHHPNLVRAGFRHFRPGRISGWVYANVWKPRLLEKVNLVHPSYYDLTWGFSYDDFKCPVIVTVHDFIYACYPKLRDGAEKTIRNQAEAIRRADFVICVSKFTENELLARFPKKKGRTSVIYHGSSFGVQPPLSERDIFERPSFLFVGGRGGYKNFAFLLRAFSKASASNRRIRLRIAGAPLTEDERWQMHFLDITDRVESFEYPDERQLLELYRSSVALVYPSLHEGFGIPLLEAMACRALVISSNATSLPEVAGNAAILLDPERESDWIEAILAAAQGGSARSSMIERGLERVGMFPWKDTVARHLVIYRQQL